MIYPKILFKRNGGELGIVWLLDQSGAAQPRCMWWVTLSFDELAF